VTDDGLEHIGCYVDAELARLERLAAIEVLVEVRRVLVVARLIGELLARELDLAA
jgi:hypothetical protein